MIVAGIDPGLGGAIAVVNAEGDCETCHMPTLGEGTQRMINAGAIASFLVERDVEFAIVEQVTAMKDWGVGGVFRFGGAYYGILCVLQVLNIPYETVAPAKWKRALSLTKDKGLSRRRATELFPRSREQFALKKDDGRAEAALLALWHLRQRERAKEAA